MHNLQPTIEKTHMPLSKKHKPETWLAIINIVLTAIIGIAVAIYLSVRNEEFQKQFLELQRNSAIAHLQIINDNEFHYEFAKDGVTIRNNGMAAAKNVRVIICISEIGRAWNDGWNQSIGDISNIEIFFSNPSLIQSQEYTTVTCEDQLEGVKKNAVLITINSLPANQTVDISVIPTKHATGESKLIRQRAFIIIPESFFVDNSKYGNPSSPEFDPDKLYYPIETALERFYRFDFTAIANFHTYVTCDNCIVETDDGTILLTEFDGMALTDLYLVSNDKNNVKISFFVLTARVFPPEEFNTPETAQNATTFGYFIYFYGWPFDDGLIVDEIEKDSFETMPP